VIEGGRGTGCKKEEVPVRGLCRTKTTASQRVLMQEEKEENQKRKKKRIRTLTREKSRSAENRWSGRGERNSPDAVKIR